MTETTTSGKRPDLIIRSFEHDRFYDFTMVKMRLRSFLASSEPNPKKRAAIIEERLQHLQAIVLRVNTVKFHLYNFLNLHFLRCLELQVPLPTEITQSFLQNLCLYLTTKNHGKKGQLLDDPPLSDQPFAAELRTSVLLYRQQMPSDYRWPSRDKSIDLLSNAAAEIVTMCANHLNLNWRSRLYRYLRVVLTREAQQRQEPEPTANSIGYLVAKILGQIPAEEDHSKHNTPAMTALANHYRQLFKAEQTEFKVAKHLDVFLPWLWTMMKEADAQDQYRFTLFPRKSSLVPGHVKICNRSLGNIQSLVSGQMVNYAKIDTHEHWREWFAVDKVKSQRRHFHHEISTDGYSVSITLRCLRPGVVPPYDLQNTPREERLQQIATIKAQEAAAKKERDQQKAKNKANGKRAPSKELSGFKAEQIVWTDYANHLGLDPGKRSLFTTWDDQGRSQHCRSREYHHLIGLKKFQRQDQLRKNLPAVKAMQQVLNENSLRVSSSPVFLTALQHLMSHYQTIQEEYQRYFYRQQRFSKYQRRGKVFKVLTKRLYQDADGPVVVGYGNGSCNAPGIKGPTMPVKAFYQHLVSQERQHLKVVVINEAMTSQKCSCCQEQTGVIRHWRQFHNQKGVEAVRKLPIHGLRRCQNNECHKTWDRDINAARNQHQLLKTEHCGGERPKYLRYHRSVPVPVPVPIAQVSKQLRTPQITFKSNKIDRETECVPIALSNASSSTPEE